MNILQLLFDHNCDHLQNIDELIIETYMKLWANFV